MELYLRRNSIMNDKTVKIIYGVATAITIGASLAQALLQGKVTLVQVTKGWKSFNLRLIRR